MATSDGDFFVNAVGRRIPKVIPGYGPTRPFAGAFSTPPPEEGGCFHPRFYGRDYEPLKETLDEALQHCGIKNGSRIGFNHDLRNGDDVIRQVMEAIERLGIRDIVLCPTALFEVHSFLTKYLQSGVIRRIEGSLNGSIGRYVSQGNLPEGEVAILRSHGGRAMSYALGRAPIDITIVTASSSDHLGNANGMHGKNNLGYLPFSISEALFSRRVIVVTDTLVPFPNLPVQISAAYVDCVVAVDSIGDASLVGSGTLEIREREPDLSIARAMMAAIEASGYLKEGFVTQAGAGNISLLSMRYLADVCEARGVKGAAMNGGTTRVMIDHLHSGLTRTLMTGQAFDDSVATSLIDDHPQHSGMTVMDYYGIYMANAGCNTNDFAMMAATEVDVDFNVNVNTHSDGYLLHGIGGHQDAAAGTKMLFIAVPTARKTNPIVVDRVTTVTTPGECVDCIVTEVGVAVNPRRADLLERFKASGLPLKTIEELRDIASEKAGRSYSPPAVTERIIAVIEWRDGTVIDVVYGVKPKPKEEN